MESEEYWKERSRKQYENLIESFRLTREEAEDKAAYILHTEFNRKHRKEENVLTRIDDQWFDGGS